MIDCAIPSAVILRQCKTIELLHAQAVVNQWLQKAIRQRDHEKIELLSNQLADIARYIRRRAGEL